MLLPTLLFGAVFNSLIKCSLSITCRLEPVFGGKRVLDNFNEFGSFSLAGGTSSIISKSLQDISGVWSKEE
jgi:hypothetical protein